MAIKASNQDRLKELEMNFLIVGFGNMGCRHAQSLLQLPGHKVIWVLEPMESIFLENLGKIGASTDQIIRIESLASLTFQIDFCVVATSANPRFEIMKSLLEIGIKKMLVEKVVFQSANQFREIVLLLKSYKAQAWCNFVNRYFSNYQKIKSSKLPGLPLLMTVAGGDFGLGCNGLHYIDLFEYLTGNPANLLSSMLRENECGNRRGKIYKEVLGQLIWETENGDRLFITAELKREGGNEILIEQKGIIDLLNEQTLQHIHFDNKNNFTSESFNLLYTSNLTGLIFKDIFNGMVLLPTVQETENCHVQFFSAINESLGLDINSLCPIT